MGVAERMLLHTQGQRRLVILMKGLVAEAYHAQALRRRIDAKILGGIEPSGALAGGGRAVGGDVEAHTGEVSGERGQGW